VADKAELHVTIGLDGTVTIETHGLKGQACLAETKDLEQALGKVEGREKTREFFLQDDKAKTGVRQR
jgi:DUF2997 family protein